MKFNPDGHLRLYDDYSASVDLLGDLLSECDYPMSCGNYGLCSNGQCSCPGGFFQDNAQGNFSLFRCKEINPTTCENPVSHSLLPLEGVYYFTRKGGIVNETNMENCKQTCLKNCSCKVALFQYEDNSSYGECLLPSPVLSLINGGKDDYYLKSFAFIKISNDDGSGRGSDTNSNPGDHGRLVDGILTTGEHGKGSPTTKIIAGLTTATFLLVGLIAGLSWMVFFRKKADGDDGMEDYLDQLSGMPTRFTYEELKAATADFQKKLGAGGFGSVFEGDMATGEKIAVKRLDFLGQGKKEFMAEVKTIGSIHHNNLVRLIGFCAEKLHRLLVYEFMCNGSLDKWIFHKEPKRPPLDWQTRRTIVLDIAKGLAYLHEDCRQRIVHLDIKPQNILLDAGLHAKISDFGLSKLIDRDQSHVVTTMRGTPGYLAPEWFSSVITEKADVYSFGIVVMEVICGRKNLDRSQTEEFKHLLPIFMKKAEEDQLEDMVDGSEDMQLHKSEAVEMMRVAIWCLHSDYTRRPSMSVVVKVLEGTVDVEADLDYAIHNPIAMAAIRREVELGTTTPVLPSFLSGPR
ncbi:G-type lectin S-receptor-like serine/threonine-protein kinase SD2-5 [Hevea brasiliensis]|nr:G-type lectin S-receptor-like serine/threonine-protein kinase SD2-5 [Hevea brasiliensis]